MSIDRSAACSGRPTAPRCCLLAIDLAALKTQERNTQDRRMTQHLATLNKILFIKGGFCVINAPKWFSFLAGALPERRWGSFNAPRSPRPLVDWGGSYPRPIPLPRRRIRRLDDYLATLSIDGTDRQTDGRTSFRYIDVRR